MIRMMASNHQPLYEEISVIGTGAYGIVYKGYDLKTERIVAMKRIRIQITNEGLPISTIREIAYLRQLEKFDHENIVKLLDVINGPRLESEQSVILIFEFIDYDLNTYLRGVHGNNLTLAKIVDLTKQLFTGVDFLHSNRIIHRDLKPQNILITKEGKLKIADFGLARIYGYSKVLTSVVVTLWYRSPEVLLQSAYSSSVDIWSCGCIFAELYLRRPLFPGQSDFDQLFKIFENLGLPTESEWPSESPISLKTYMANEKLANKKKNLASIVTNMDVNGLDLLSRLLDFDINRRITAQDALKHAYFTQANQQATAAAISSEDWVSLLPDITNSFQNQQHQHQPNILKRKRILNNNNNSNSQANNQNNKDGNENDSKQSQK